MYTCLFMRITPVLEEVMVVVNKIVVLEQMGRPPVVHTLSVEDTLVEPDNHIHFLLRNS